MHDGIELRKAASLRFLPFGLVIDRYWFFITDTDYLYVYLYLFRCLLVK